MWEGVSKQPQTPFATFYQPFQTDCLYLIQGFSSLPTEKPGACFHAKRAPAMKIQLSATDVLAPTTMKNAAKCDT